MSDIVKEVVAVFLNSLNPQQVDDALEYRLVKMFASLGWTPQDVDAFFELPRGQRLVDSDLNLVIIKE
jgi:hypothetical protein